MVDDSITVERPASADLAGEWIVADATGVLGTATAFVDDDGRGGKVIFRDAETLLHSKVLLAPDLDPVLRCGPVGAVPAAPAEMPLVIREPDYATSSKFWRPHRVGESIVWQKTTLHFCDHNGLGWYRETDSDDPEMRPGVARTWTRPAAARAAARAAERAERAERAARTPSERCLRSSSGDARRGVRKGSRVR